MALYGIKENIRKELWCVKSYCERCKNGLTQGEVIHLLVNDLKIKKVLQSDIYNELLAFFGFKYI